MKNIVLYISSLIIIIIALLIIKTKFLNKLIPNDIENNLNKNSFVQSKADIEILNGCGQPGIANLFTHFLRAHNYDVIEIKNADNFKYGETYIIINHSNKIAIAKDLVELLAINEKNILIDKSKLWDMSIIIGKDYKILDSFNEIKKYYEPF